MAIRHPDRGLLNAIGPHCSNLGAVILRWSSATSFGLDSFLLKNLCFIRICPDQYLQNFYGFLGRGVQPTLSNILGYFFKYTDFLIGLQIPLPCSPTESPTISLSGLEVPQHFTYLALFSFGKHATFDLQSVYLSTIGHLALINIFIDPFIPPRDYDESHWYFMERGPRIYLGGSDKETTLKIFEEIIDIRP